MDPITMMLLAQLVPAGMQFIQGIKQKKLASEYAPKEDPTYNIPESAKAALAGAEVNAASRYMSGQTNMQNMLNQGTANTTADVLKGSRSPLDALGALTQIHGQNQAGQQQIGFKAANDYQDRQRELRGQQGIMAGYEDKKWTNDVLNKFLRDSATSSALQNAGMRNKFEGIKGASNAFGFAAGEGLFDKKTQNIDTTGVDPNQFSTLFAKQNNQFATPNFNPNAMGQDSFQAFMQMMLQGNQPMYAPQRNN